MRTVSKLKYSGLAAAAFAAAFLLAPEAQAAGCNGVVNPVVWGCAPWDNNNGPNYPNYKRPVTRSQPSNGANAVPPPQVRGNGLIGQDGAGIVSNDGATLQRRN